MSPKRKREFWRRQVRAIKNKILISLLPNQNTHAGTSSFLLFFWLEKLQK
jgi:hypothetical protein